MSASDALKFLSPASRIALQIGQEEAQQGGVRTVEPAHVYIALCKVCDLDVRRMFQERGAKDSWQQADDEARKVRSAFKAVHLDPVVFRRRLRAAIGHAEDFSSAPSIDQDCSELLTEANERRVKSEAGEIKLIHLLAALAQREWAPWSALMSEMGIKKEDLLAQAVALCAEREASRPLTTATMTRVPSAEAIMVGDICDSTGLAQLHGDRLVLRLKNAVKDIAQEVTLKNRVKFAKGTGDGFLMTFDGCREAVTSATEILEKVRQYNEAHPAQPEVALRFGIDFGEVYADKDGDRSGNAVNLAFRVEGTKIESMHETTSAAITRTEFPQKNRILITYNVFKQLSAINAPFQCLKAGYFDYKGFEGFRIAVYLVSIARLGKGS